MIIGWKLLTTLNALFWRGFRCGKWIVMLVTGFEAFKVSEELFLFWVSLTLFWFVHLFSKTWNSSRKTYFCFSVFHCFIDWIHSFNSCFYEHKHLLKFILVKGSNYSISFCTHHMLSLRSFYPNSYTSFIILLLFALAVNSPTFLCNSVCLKTRSPFFVPYL